MQGCRGDRTGKGGRRRALRENPRAIQGDPTKWESGRNLGSARRGHYRRATGSLAGQDDAGEDGETPLLGPMKGRFTCSEPLCVWRGSRANAEFRGWYVQKRNRCVVKTWEGLRRARRETDEGREERVDETKADKG